MAKPNPNHGGRFYVVDGKRMREAEYLALKKSQKAAAKAAAKITEQEKPVNEQ